MKNESAKMYQETEAGFYRLQSKTKRYNTVPSNRNIRTSLHTHLVRGN